MKRKCPALILQNESVSSAYFKIEMRLFVSEIRFFAVSSLYDCGGDFVLNCENGKQTRSRNRRGRLLYRLFLFVFRPLYLRVGKTSISEFGAHPSWCLHVPRGVSGFVYCRREQQGGKRGHLKINIFLSYSYNR